MTFFDYAKRGQTAFWRYLVCLILAIVVTIILTFLFVVLLILFHLLPADFAQQMQSPAHPNAFYIGLLMSFGPILAGLCLSVALVHKKRMLDLLGSWKWRSVLIGFSIWLGFLILATGVDMVLRPRGFSLTAKSLSLPLCLLALVSICIQTFAEEYIFRGYITQGLLVALKRPWIVAVLSGLIFGAFHIPNGWPQAVNATVFGIVMAMLAMRTGGLGLGYGIHLINNLFGAIIVVSGDDVFRGTPGLFTQHTPDLLWWDTATSAVGLIGLLILVFKKSAPFSGPMQQQADLKTQNTP